jgi:16S rRNA (cytidine1402-2'-O)-methyltransferase
MTQENERAHHHDSPGGSPRKATLWLEGCRISVTPPPPGLHVVATPIGNLGDITLRALKTLAGADAVLAEDTRHTGRLLEHFGISNRLIAYHEHNAARMRPRVLDMLATGAALALVTDAGTPLISDPGMKLVREAAAAGHAVHAVPGPSAAIAALSVAGLPSDRFLFAGFPPPRTKARRRWLTELATIPATLIIYESPHRIVSSLADMAEILGNREAVLARELTKLHEELLRAPLAELARILGERDTIRGEITLIIAPPPRQAMPAASASGEETTQAADLEEELRKALQSMPASRAARELAKRFGRPRREVYALALRIASGDRKDEGGKD